MSSFNENLEKCIVKDGQSAINELSPPKFLFNNKAWWDLPIKVHHKSVSCYFAEKNVTAESGYKSIERYIISPNLQSIFKKRGYKIAPRTCYLWKNTQGQHGVALIHKTAKTSYCISGREAMALAQTNWHMFEKDTDTDTYNSYSLAELGKAPPVNDPKWHGSYEEMLEEAVAEMMVTSKDHPVVQELLKQKKHTSPRIAPKKKNLDITSSPSKTPLRSDASSMIDDILGDED